MPSDAFKQSAFASETDEVWLVIATISHVDLMQDINVVNDLRNLVSNGVLYNACPFRIQLPNDTDERPPRARFSVDNVDQELGAALRRINSAPTLRLRVVAASDPDTVEVDYGDMELQDCRVDMRTVYGTIGLENLDLEPFPNGSFSPSYFPGLF